MLSGFASGEEPEKEGKSWELGEAGERGAAGAIGSVEVGRYTETRMADTRNSERL